MQNQLETTNFQPTPVRLAALPTFEALRDKRVIVESRGNPDEYLALAREFAAIGADACASSLRIKAQGMKGFTSESPETFSASMVILERGGSLAQAVSQ